MSGQRRDLGTEDFAELIDVSSRTVRRLIASGQVRAYNVGVKGPRSRVRWRIKWAEYERYTSGKRTA